jgi:hypothetical protein
MRKRDVLVSLIIIGALVGVWSTHWSLVAGGWLFVQNSLMVAGYVVNRRASALSRTEMTAELDRAHKQIEALKGRNSAVERQLIDLQKKEIQTSERTHLYSGRF